MYVDDVDSDEEEKHVDTVNDICRGHGIAVSVDPQNVRFEIFSTRIDEQSKRVVSTIFCCSTFIKKLLGLGITVAENTTPQLR